MQLPKIMNHAVAFGSMWLTERLKDFIEMYPEIEVALIVREDELNLSMRQADVAIRLAPPQQPDLIQRHLFTMRHGAFAAAGYLERHGMPHSVEDLDRHRLIAYDETYHPPFTDINWLLHAGLEPGKSRRPVLRVNNIYGIYRAVQSGVGVAALPDYTVRQISNLVHILPEMNGPTYECFFVYPAELRASKRVAVFRDFLLGQISESLF